MVFKEKFLKGLDQPYYTSEKAMFGKFKILVDRDRHKEIVRLKKRDGTMATSEEIPDIFSDHFYNKLKNNQTKLTDRKFKKHKLNKYNVDFKCSKENLVDSVKHLNEKLSSQWPFTFCMSVKIECKTEVNVYETQCIFCQKGPTIKDNLFS